VSTLKVLPTLDAAASKFDFLILDNTNIDIADARLTVFVREDDWLIFLEDVGWAEPENAFVNGIYGFGTGLSKQGLQGERIPVAENPAEPLSHPKTGRCSADSQNWSVIISGEIKRFTPSADEYARAGIRLNPNTEVICPKDIMHFLVQECGHVFFATDADLLRFASTRSGFQKLIQTTEWQHPDVAGKEFPSDNISMRSLARAIQERRAEAFEKGVPNTNWAGGPPFRFRR
jgi:hypothetical protein